MNFLLLFPSSIVSSAFVYSADFKFSWFWGCPLAAAIEIDQIVIVKMLLAVDEVDINGIRHVQESASTSQEDEKDPSKLEGGAEVAAQDCVFNSSARCSSRKYGIYRREL